MSTPPRPIRRRRVDWLPWSVALLLSVVFGTVGFVAGRSSAGRPATIAVGPQQAAAAGLQDDGRQAVEAWLAENLDSGEWEEVRWWPAREAGEGWKKDFKIDSPVSIARMKYRTQNRVGGTELRDDYFFLSLESDAPMVLHRHARSHGEFDGYFDVH